MGGGRSRDDLWLLEHLGVPASLHDTDGYFIDLNAAAERAGGRPREEWLGRTYQFSIVPEARPMAERAFRGVVETGVIAEFETTFTDGGGQIRGTRTLHLPVKDGDEVVAVLILAFAGPASTGGYAEPPRLTRRQLEVLGLIALGLTTDEIVARLSVSRETVRNHIRHALRAVGARTRPEAVAAARRLGLLAPRPLPAVEDEVP